MTWWKKEDKDLPQELQDMKPEDLVAAVQKAGKVDELESSLAAEKQAREAEKTEFEDVKSRLAAIEAGGGNPPAAPAGGDGDPPRLTSFLVDEDRAFAERMAPVLQSSWQSGSLAAREVARRQCGPLFARWEKEIDEVMKSVPLAQHPYPESWSNAFTLIKGRHADQMVEDTRKGKGEYFIEPAGGGEPAPDPDPKDKDKLSPDEIKVAAAMRVPPEKYAEMRKNIKFLGQ